MKIANIPQSLSDAAVYIPNTPRGYNQAPSVDGVYLYLEKTVPIYIGKARNIKARLKSHAESAKSDRKEHAIVQSSDSVAYIETDSEFKALLLESRLISLAKPKFNARWRDDKSPLYIKITLAEAFPKVNVVRREKQAGAYYAGPFPSRRSALMIIRAIRRIIPFCTQKRLAKRACFYAKIGLCNPCPNTIQNNQDPESQKQQKRVYRTHIRRIIRILEGDTDTIRHSLERELKILSAKEQYEQAIILRNRLYLLEHLIHDRMMKNDIEVSFNESTTRMSGLHTLLLPFFPAMTNLTRIECYDASHLNRKEAVASMVVATDGLTDKAAYRKFKIKKPKNVQSDFDMLCETLSRRLKHTSWEKPDLIILDGGKPQVRMAIVLLARLKVSIPIIGIAKRPDRLIIGSRDFPILRPPIHHPGFMLVRALRDEAHRFSRSYHRLLRTKSLGIS